MSCFKSNFNRFLVVLPLMSIVFLSSCSDDNAANKEVAANKEAVTKEASVAKSIVGNNKNMTANKIADAEHYKQMSKAVEKANWVEKGKFKKEFTKDCISREIATAGDNKVDTSYIEKTCACIADYMDNHLTDQEADEYLKEDNHVRSFQMRYDAGAYECVQEFQKAVEPTITRFQ